MGPGFESQRDHKKRTKVRFFRLIHIFFAFLQQYSIHLKSSKTIPPGVHCGVNFHGLLLDKLNSNPLTHFSYLKLVKLK
ncbi:hypothetical protein D7322_27600 [Sphingobacterium puteale]|uniref:Uncharacterized protein n=1 Tax=Sphingobacterium puteale TaxID=2420510 RepID=A0A420VPX6_9SPHI|nr:hypothetical protein D7322_27600 [Sphingobacterium puteale]